jgi:2-phospho-L-lactate guanylyltransferase
VSGVWALVPVKCFARGKSRLAGVLAGPARQAFSRALGEHVLAALKASPAIDGVLVVTDCAVVAGVARRHGALVVRDACIGSLAPIVDGALATLAARGARAALVLMGDLPGVTAAEIGALVRALDAADVVLAPDGRDEGTNALGLSPPDRFPTCFGTADSFDRHRVRAAGRGDRVAIHRSEGLALDVDTPEDYLRVAPLGPLTGRGQVSSIRQLASRGARFRWKRKRPSRVRAA